MTAISAPARSAAFDPTDIPRIDAVHLARMLDLLVDRARPLSILGGEDRESIDNVEADFWRDFSGDTATGVAAVVRFRALVEVFSSRRLMSLLMNQGFGVLKAAFHVAADMRLNAARGFNPQGLVWAVTAELAAVHRGHRSGYGSTILIAA